MGRIELEDNFPSMLAKLSEGNPGAMAALMDAYSLGSEIDPQNFMGPFGALLDLDTLGIYGSGIYVLWSDICHKETNKFIALLRGCQLGIVEGSLLVDIVSRQDYSGRALIDVEDIYQKVRAELELFDRDEPPK